MPAERDSPSTAPHILVVDDDIAMRRLIELILLSDGYRVTAAASAAEALQVLAADTFDLLMMDLDMPVMGGRELFTLLRARGHSLPVMVVSAHGAEYARRELGADASLAKPFDIDQLTECVRILVARAR